MTSFFSAKGGLIWIKFRRLVQNDMSTAVIWSKSKPEVEFKYGGRLCAFHGMSSYSHLPHCRVLPLREFNVMIPELRVTLRMSSWKVRQNGVFKGFRGRGWDIWWEPPRNAMTADLRRLVKKLWRCSKYPSLYMRPSNYKKKLNKCVSKTDTNPPFVFK